MIKYINKKILHGYRQLMLKNFWLSSVMSETPLLFVKTLSLIFLLFVFNYKRLSLSFILRDHC